MRRVNRLCAILAVAATAVAQTGAPPARAKARIILVGDSTVASRTGWGNSFCLDYAPETACVNKARGGRSTKSYREDGSWADVLQMLARNGDYAATYVLIQFGHNDQPGKPGRSTDLATEFPVNLKRYVEEVRAAGATPVLVTSLSRRQFGPDGRVKDGLQPWADATIKVAAEERAPLVDLHADSLAAINKMGPEDANTLAMAPPPGPPATDTPVPAAVISPAPVAKPGEPVPTFDYTHLGKKGAELFAKMVAIDLARAVPDLRSAIKNLEGAP